MTGGLSAVVNRRWIAISSVRRARMSGGVSPGCLWLSTRISRCQAGQDVRRRIARVFVAVDADQSATISGFYSLSAASVEARTLPPELAHKPPRYPLPAALIGRLAVAKRYQGQQFGKYLLMDALTRTLAASTSIAIYAIIVDALDERAEFFYEKYGFQKLSGLTRRLFIPLQTVSAAVGSIWIPVSSVG